MTPSMGEPRYPFVHVDVTLEDADEVGALLFELGADGVEERDETTLAKNATAGRITLVGSFSTRAEADRAITQLDASMSPRYEEVVGDAWRDAWKEHYKPYAIAEGIVVRPPWEAYEAKSGERVLELEPGRAFGTGLHETTRLVARAIKAHADEVKGLSEGAILFRLNCARCHTKGWSSYDPTNIALPPLSPQGGGAYGPNLRDGATLLQFPGRAGLLPSQKPTQTATRQSGGA